MADADGRGNPWKWLVALQFAACAALAVCLLCLHVRTAELEGALTRGRGISKRSAVTEAAAAAHFHGAIPVQRILREGTIGPWTSDTFGTGGFAELKNGDKEVELLTSGVYFIYAQVVYITSSTSNSFEILTYAGGELRRAHRTVAVCSSSAPDGRGREAFEVSCSTATAAALSAGDRVFLSQIEQNRVIRLGRGHSFLGLIRLGR